MDWFKPKMPASQVSNLLIAYTVSGNLNDEPETMALKVAIGPGYYGDTGDEKFIRIDQIMIRSTAVHRMVHAIKKPKRQIDAVWSAYTATMEKWADDGLLVKLLDDWLMGFEARLLESDFEAHGISALGGAQINSEEDVRRLISCMGHHYAQNAAPHSQKPTEDLVEEGKTIFLCSLDAVHTILEKVVAGFRVI